MSNNRYIRQTTLKEVGEKGQQKLFETKVLIVGCGGLGNYTAVNLAASGIGEIHLIDFDTIDISNLHRQVFFKTTDVGKSKSEVLAKYIASINNEVKVSFSNKKIEKNEIRILVKNYDYVLECTDDLETKYMINDACVLENKPMIYASLHKFEAHIASFNITNTGKRTANLRDAFPEIPTENIPTCSEVGTLNPIVGIAGFLQANEVLKLIFNIGEPLVNKLLIYNSLENSQVKINLLINKKLNFKKIWENTNYDHKTCSLLDPNEISFSDFKLKLKSKKIKVISVLEEKTTLIPVDYHFPFSEIETVDIQLKKHDYIIICLKGKSSLASLFILQTKYPNINFKSLHNGIENIINAS